MEETRETYREVRSNAVTGALEACHGHRESDWLGLWRRRDCKGRENFQLSCTSQIYK